MNKENGFYLIHTTSEDVKKENQEKANNLSEDSKSEFIFNGEYFYLVGHGHQFGPVAGHPLDDPTAGDLSELRRRRRARRVRRVNGA